MKIEPIVAQDLYGQALKATKPAQDSGEVSGLGFADTIEQALQDMRATMEAGEKAAADAMTGRGDLQNVVEALTATEMALETAVAVRDRVVEAYHEILRMPV